MASKLTQWQSVSETLFEPTPIDIVNNMDHICINGNYMVAGSTDAIKAVDFNKDGKADFPTT